MRRYLHLAVILEGALHVRLEVVETVSAHFKALEFLIGQQDIELAVVILMYQRIFNVGNDVLKNKIAQLIRSAAVDDAVIDTDKVISRGGLVAIA